MKQLAILGSTGSIGTQALDVISLQKNKFRVTALAAYHNDSLLEEQIDLFKPDIAVLVDKQSAENLIRRYRGTTKILTGEEGLLEAATYPKADIVLTSMVGFAGLKPTLAAIKAGKDIALANKETLVAAGELVMSQARAHGVKVLPVDSEHSAILQCLQGENVAQVKKLILTASGGPFRGYSASELQTVGIEECLKHPNWSMGKKITVDSATLANKGLEVMEAKWLFGVDYDQIEVVIHPQSVIHSMVEFADGAIKAQLGMPDMKIPIQYALTYPDRVSSTFPMLDFKTISCLEFEEPDYAAFPALKLAYSAGRVGGTLPCVFNAANEIAVYAFLCGEIRFVDIVQVVHDIINKHEVILKPELTDICRADAWARELALDTIRAVKN